MTLFVLMISIIEKMNKSDSMAFPQPIRRYDTSISALARLIDSSIILITFWSLQAVLSQAWQPIYGWEVLLIIILFNFFAEAQDTYRSWRDTRLREALVNIVTAWSAAVVILLVTDLLFVQSRFYHEPLLISWLLITPLEIITWHIILRSLLKKLRQQAGRTHRVAILGATELGYQLAKNIERMDWSGYQLEGYYDDRDLERLTVIQQHKDVLLKGDLAQLAEDCRQGKVDTVFITLAISADIRMHYIADTLANSTASVYLVPNLFTINLLNARWSDFQGITAISIYESPFCGIKQVVKRLEDIVLSLLILLVISIPMIVIAIAIRITSPGPILFKQLRYGVDGEKIAVWKFRSMSVMEEGDTVQQVTRDDDRVTPLGRFLRRHSLDELPQFFNSLEGSMSIVGPRPHAVIHNEIYREQISGYMLRHKVKPGITGLAQINGYRGETDTLDKMAGRIRYDLRYIQKWSLLLDLKIIALTAIKGFKDDQAY